MRRLLPALVLALACHVLFLRLRLPAGPDSPPQIPAVREVTVSLARAAPQRETGPAAVKVAAPAVIKKQEKAAKPLKPLRPKAADERKKVIPEPVKKELESRSAEARPLRRQEKQNTEVRKSVSGTGAGADIAAQQQSAAGVVRQAEPAYDLNPAPEYPLLARRRGWQGTVLLAVEVKEDGTVGAVSVRTGSTYSILDEAALKAVEKWRFRPATKDGLPVAMEVLVPVHFVLHLDP
ncbi:MAG: TonB family protein [Proteobacteria bacterium]|nr:TonB family protein [Pseudomonadota bacterium]